MSPDEQAIRELVAAWMDASRSGDLAAVLGLMTEDVVFLVPGCAPFGKQEFAAAAASMAALRIEAHSEIEEVQVAGEWAFLRNRLTITATPPDGPTVRRAGHTLTILRREADGRWRVARDANLLVRVPNDAGTSGVAPRQ